MQSPETAVPDIANTTATDIVVPSLLLMPPPTGFPVAYGNTKALKSQCKLHSVKQVVHTQDRSTDENNTFGVQSKPVTTSRILRCYVPVWDVHCSITNNTTIDEFTKKLVNNQISNKIFCTPKKPNTRLTPKKTAETIKPRPLKFINKKLKFNMKHFHEKQLNIDDIDVECLQCPMRCSTPTPSHDGSKILAGHLDVSFDDLFSTLDQELDEEDNEVIDDADNEYYEFLQQFVNKCTTPTKVEKKQAQKSSCTDKNPFHGKEHASEMAKRSYCNDWMEKEVGVSTDNNDVPPLHLCS